jgi:hypothetical protein
MTVGDAGLEAEVEMISTTEMPGGMYRLCAARIDKGSLLRRGATPAGGRVVVNPRYVVQRTWVAVRGRRA